MSSVFIDTNIWLYAVIECGEKNKSNIAREVINSEENINVSVQVINEVCFNLIKKANFAENEIEKIIDSFYNKTRVFDINRKTLLTACNIRKKYDFSFWDSFIVTLALESRSSILFSEDMQHGLIVDKKVKIINPFKIV